MLWLVYVNDTPVGPERPLDAEEVIEHFRDQVELSDPDDGDRIEIRVFDNLR